MCRDCALLVAPAPSAGPTLLTSAAVIACKAQLAPATGSSTCQWCQYSAAAARASARRGACGRRSRDEFIATFAKKSSHRSCGDVLALPEGPALDSSGHSNVRIGFNGSSKASASLFVLNVQIEANTPKPEVTPYCEHHRGCQDFTCRRHTVAVIAIGLHRENAIDILPPQRTAGSDGCFSWFSSYIFQVFKGYIF